MLTKILLVNNAQAQAGPCALDDAHIVSLQKGRCSFVENARQRGLDGAEQGTAQGGRPVRPGPTSFLPGAGGGGSPHYGHPPSPGTLSPAHELGTEVSEDRRKTV